MKSFKQIALENMFKELLDRNKEGFYIYKRPWGSFVSENRNANYKLKRICYRIKMGGVRASIEIGQWHAEVYKVKWSDTSVWDIIFTMHAIWSCPGWKQL